MVVSAEGASTITFSATDAAGNASATGSATVQIDTQAPVVTYSGNAGAYTVDQTVNITCSAADPTPGSGLASDTAPTHPARVQLLPGAKSSRQPRRKRQERRDGLHELHGRS